MYKDLCASINTPTGEAQEVSTLYLVDLLVRYTKGSRGAFKISLLYFISAFYFNILCAFL